MAIRNVNTITYVVAVDGVVVGEYDNYDKAYHELRAFGLLVTVPVTLTSKIKK